jgi:hypothetical protein
MRSVAGTETDTAACDDEVAFAHMRPGWPASKPSAGATARRGYAKLSAVVKTRDDEAALEELSRVRESAVSGPERRNGPETSSVSVYGGPHEVWFRATLRLAGDARVQVRRVEGECGVERRRSRFWPGALGAWGDGLAWGLFEG